MSTVDHAQTKTLLPPLAAGQQLDQPTFHERYEAMPEGTWAELVGGRVYMPSPVRNEHSEMDRLVEVLDQGMATPAHAAFAAKLIAAGADKRPR
jgi:hypothetical protein